MQSTANGSETQRAPVAAQWPGVPYPGGAMIMPNQMMPPPPPFGPHYIPFHGVPPPLLPQFQQHPVQQPGSADENRTLWVGDLQYWMDENYLQLCFGHTGEVSDFL